MKVEPTAIPGVLILEPRVFQDERGWFLEEYRDERFEAHGLPSSFRQDNRSRSRRGVLRGLHYQLERPQGKLVSCVAGKIFDVAVDVRRGSPTFGKWVGVELSGDLPRQFWIPPGFAHGFCTLSDWADVTYKCTDIYDPAAERGILWCDPDVAIEWPLRDPMVSSRDQALKRLADPTLDLPTYSG